MSSGHPSAVLVGMWVLVLLVLILWGSLPRPRGKICCSLFSHQGQESKRPRMRPVGASWWHCRGRKTIGQAADRRRRSSTRYSLPLLIDVTSVAA